MPTPPCSTLRTLTITFVPSLITPFDGYTVRWRIVGDTAWNTVTGLYGNPITIAGVPDCYNIEGTIQANCANGQTSNAATFGVVGSSTTCKYHTLLDDATYIYVGCGETLPTSIVNVSTSPTTICAIVGTVSGGDFEQQTISCNS